MNPPRLLLLLDQLPQDPSSGAARTSRTICEFLAASGAFTVQALATTATESGSAEDVRRHLPGDLQVIEPSGPGKDRPILRFSTRGIDYSILDSSIPSNTGWEPAHGAQFDRMLDTCLAGFTPDLVFTYGGQPSMIERWRRARARGARIVFGLWNHGYLQSRRFFDEIDYVLTPSRFLTEKYQRRLGVASTPLPSPMDLDDVVAAEHDPLFLTFINPSIQKGVMFMARFAEELARQRPDIRLMVVESRGDAGALVAAGLLGGFYLRRHGNIMVSPGVSHSREIFTVTRVLLAPSVWEEPSGRVASEALVNGVPPIVSNRGGLPEECRGAGIVLPLPDSLTLETRKPVAPEDVQPWIAAAVQFADDEDFYHTACAQARVAGKTYHPERLREAYATFFRSALDGKAPAASGPHRIRFEHKPALEFVTDSDRPDLGGNLRHGDPATFSPRVWKYVIDELNIRSVLDVGSGEGYAARWFHQQGLETHALDGLPLNVERAVHPTRLHDLTESEFVCPVDLVYCVEVVEHIDSKYLVSLMRTLANGRYVLITHALPGQVGCHHVNCRPMSCWLKRFAEYGYTPLDAHSTRIRRLAMEEKVPTFFAQSGLLFSR